MFKLMIADDNPHTLQGLSEIIDWETFDFDLVGTFSNGLELLEAARANMPDLVLADIAMPVMNGFELSAQLSALKPDIKIVFVSSYNEFSYARTALKLGVYDYILKPIKTDQLLDIMNRVLSQLRQEQIKHFEQQKLKDQHDYYRRVALSHYISRLFFQAQNEQSIVAELEHLGISVPTITGIQVVCYSTNVTLDSDNPLHSFDYLKSLLENELEEAEIIPAVFPDDQGAFLLITHTQVRPVSDMLSQLSVDIEAKMDLHITMGYSMSSRNFTDLPMLYQQAQSALWNLQNGPITAPIASFSDIHVDYDAEPATESAPAGSTATYNANVAAMRTFIEEHYMESITSDDVTKSVYLSSSYANRCFLAECGTTIFGYISHCRLEKAKQLLRDTDMHITRIAESVGYSAKTSFYLAFKRHMGISPTEYRQQNTETL